MKKLVVLALGSFLTLNAFANQEQDAQPAPSFDANVTAQENTIAPNAPWDKIECRATDIWGHVFTASGHNWKSSRATELQNEALDKCSQVSGWQYCSPMGCVVYQ